MIADVLAAVLLVIGSLLTLIGGVGILRMPDFYTRMHAAGVTDTAGAGAILLGLAIYAGWGLVAAKVLAILVFMMLTNPTSSHALARAAMHGEDGPELKRGDGD